MAEVSAESAIHHSLQAHVSQIRMLVASEPCYDNTLRGLLDSLEALVEASRVAVANLTAELKTTALEECALQARHNEQLSALSEVRERAANSESQRAELSLKIRSLSIELDTSRRDLTQLRRKVREADTAAAARSRSGSNAASVSERGEGSGASASASASISPSPVGGRPVPVQLPPNGLGYRSRARTQETASTQGSFSNLAAFFSKGTVPTDTPAQASADVGPLQAQYRSRAGSLPLSPSRHVGTRTSARPAGGAQTSVMDSAGVPFTGRSSPVAPSSSTIDWIGAGAERGGDACDGDAANGTIAPRPLSVGLDEMLGMTLEEWQVRDMQRRSRIVAFGVGFRPHPRTSPSPGASRTLQQDGKGLQAAPAVPFNHAAPIAGAAAPVWPWTGSRTAPGLVQEGGCSAGEEVLVEETAVMEGGPEPVNAALPPSSVSTVLSSARVPDSPSQARSPDGAPATTNGKPTWSSVANMWSTWIAGSTAPRPATPMASIPTVGLPTAGACGLSASTGASPSPALLAESQRPTVSLASPGAKSVSTREEASAFKQRTRSLPGVLFRAANSCDLDLDDIGNEDSIEIEGEGAVERDVTVASITSPHASERTRAGSSGPAVSVGSILASMPLFVSLTGPERHILAASFEPVHACTGEVIFYNDGSIAPLRSEPALLLVLQGVIAVSEAGSRCRADSSGQGQGLLSPPLSSRKVFTAGQHFLLSDLPDGCLAVARTRASMLVLRAGVLQGLLEWFADARGIGQRSAGASGTRGDSKRRMDRIQAIVQAAADLSSYIASLRRVSPLAHSLDMPPRPSSLQGSGRGGWGGRGGRLTHVKREVDQAYKDFTRESAVLVNGEYVPLGTPERFQHFVSFLAEVVRREFVVDCVTLESKGAEKEKEGTASMDADAPCMNSVQAENIVASVVCDLLIAASRTVTGGDTFVQANVLFGRPELSFIAAESGAQSPTELTIGRWTAHVRSVSTFKVCAMAMDGPTEGSHGGGDGAALNGSAAVWGLLRCKLDEDITYAAGRALQSTARHSQDVIGPGPGIASALSAIGLSTLWAGNKAHSQVVGPAVQAETVQVDASTCAPPVATAPPTPTPPLHHSASCVGDMASAIARASEGGDNVNIRAATRVLDVAIHVFDTPE